MCLAPAKRSMRSVCAVMILLIMIVVLIVRPQGIIGEKERDD